MNEYEIDVFSLYAEPQTTTHRVQAHSAADALTCFEHSLPKCTKDYVSAIRCVERAPVLQTWPASPFPEMTLTSYRCMVCHNWHGHGLMCPLLMVTSG